MKRRLMLMLPMLHQGGFERVAVATARLLADDYDVALCIFSDKNIHYDVSDLRIINLDVPSSKNRARKVFNVLLRIVRAHRVKRRERIDITYSFGNTANPVNIFSRAGDRVITGLRCGTDLETPGIVRACVRRSDLVLSCSKEILALLKRDFACGGGAYLYNPLDVEDIRKKAAERQAERGDGTFRIVTMGRDDVIKAHWHMIKAFYLVSRELPEARLSVIGAGKYEAWRRLAEELGIAERVTFTGNLTDPFPEIDAADLYVLPSNREGFPNALLEAMALGKPVIATDCRTGPREILLDDAELEELLKKYPYGTSTAETVEGQYGILIPDMSDTPDPDPSHLSEERVLADMILKMAQDTDYREKYAARAAKRAGDFCPGNYRKDLIRILEGV